MDDTPARELVLVPLQVLEGQTLDEDLARLLSPLQVIVLGYHVVPEQTAPGQMRQQFEPQGLKALEAIEDSIQEAGGSSDSRLLFTHVAEQSIDRVLEEVGATALALPNPSPPVDSVLVSLRGEVDAERVATFVARLRSERDIDITLFAAAKESDIDAAERLVSLAATSLDAAGVPEQAIARRTELTDRPVEAIIETAIEHDATVMGERAPDWRSFVFGELEDRIAAESLGPVLVVRREPVDEHSE